MNKRAELTLAAVLLVIGWNIGCTASRKPVDVQNRLLQKLRTLSPDWDNVRVVGNDIDQQLVFLASFQRDGERYTMQASEERNSEYVYAVELCDGDVDGYDSKPTQQILIGGYIEQKDHPERLELNEGLRSAPLPLWDEAKLKRFLPIAEQFRQVIRDVL